jgi:hypothetical protein
VIGFAPGASVTVAVQLVVPEAVPDWPVAAFDHVTVATATLSDATPASATLDDPVVHVGAVVGLLIWTDGGVVSPEDGVYVIVIVAWPLFPAASYAVIVIRLLPLASGTVAVQFVVPDAGPLPPVAAFAHVTPVTATLSAAVPVIVTGDDVTVAVGGAGFTIVTVGGCVSDDEPTVSVTERVVFPPPFVTFSNVIVSV